jgi:hypothetical protein
MAGIDGLTRRDVAYEIPLRVYCSNTTMSITAYHIKIPLRRESVARLMPASSRLFTAKLVRCPPWGLRFRDMRLPTYFIGTYLARGRTRSSETEKRPHKGF